MKFYIQNKMLGLNLLTSSGMDENGEVDFSPITNLISGIGTSILSAILVMVGVYLIFLIVKIGFRISQAAADGDTEAKSKAIKDIIWVCIGAFVVFTAGITSAVFAGIFLNK